MALDVVRIPRGRGSQVSCLTAACGMTRSQQPSHCDDKRRGADRWYQPTAWRVRDGLLGAPYARSHPELSMAPSQTRHRGGAGSGREAADRETTARPTPTLQE